MLELGIFIDGHLDFFILGFEVGAYHLDFLDQFAFWMSHLDRLELKFLSRADKGLELFLMTDSFYSLLISFISILVVDFGLEKVAADGENDPFQILSSSEF